MIILRYLSCAGWGPCGLWQASLRFCLLKGQKPFYVYSIRHFFSPCCVLLLKLLSMHIIKVLILSFAALDPHKKIKRGREAVWQHLWGKGLTADIEARLHKSEFVMLILHWWIRKNKFGGILWSAKRINPLTLQAEPSITFNIFSSLV